MCSIGSRLDMLMNLNRQILGNRPSDNITGEVKDNWIVCARGDVLLVELKRNSATSTPRSNARLNSA